MGGHAFIHTKHETLHLWQWKQKDFGQNHGLQCTLIYMNI